MYAKIDILLSLDQFKELVPDTLVCYLAYGILIHFETIDVSVSNVYEVREKPHSLLIWDSSNTTPTSNMSQG